VDATADREPARPSAPTGSALTWLRGWPIWKPTASWCLPIRILSPRVKTAAALNEADRASFFGGAAPGYTDYPALEAATAA